MRYSSFILLFLSAALCTTRLTAQNNAGATAAQNTTGAPDAVGSTLTLPQAVAIAIKNNLAINQNDLIAQGAKINVDQSWEFMLPTLSASGGQSLNFGRTLVTTNNSYASTEFNSGSAGINAGLTVFHGLVYQNNIRMQRYAWDASKMDLQQQKDNITLNVLVAYLLVLSNRDQVNLAYEQSRVDSVQLVRLTAQGKEGALNPVSSLTDLQGQYASDQINIANAINTLEQSKVALFALLNVSYNRDVEYQNTITATDINQYPAASDSIFQHAMGIIPSIKSAQLRVYEYQKNLAVQRGYYYPTISLGGSVSTNWTNAPSPTSSTVTSSAIQKSTSTFTDAAGNNPVYDLVPLTSQNIYPKFSDQFKNDRGESIGLNVSIPILNGLQQRNAVRQAKLTLKNYQYQNTNARFALQQTVESAFQSMILAYKSYKFYVQEAAAYEESFRITNIRFTEGVIASDVYIQAKGRSDQAEVNLAAAKYIYLFRTKVLDYYQGKLTIE
jgi:outer membrane protein